MDSFKPECHSKQIIPKVMGFTPVFLLLLAISKWKRKKKKVLLKHLLLPLLTLELHGDPVKVR